MVIILLIVKWESDFYVPIHLPLRPITSGYIIAFKLFNAFLPCSADQIEKSNIHFLIIVVKKLLVQQKNSKKCVWLSHSFAPQLNWLWGYVVPSVLSEITAILFKMKRYQKRPEKSLGLRGLKHRSVRFKGKLSYWA